MDPQQRQTLINVYRDGLLRDTIPFWCKHGIDRKHGGFFTSLNRDGTIIDTDKGVWQQGRATWLFGELYNNVERREEWLQHAIRGAEFLTQHCYDPVDGRMWFHVTQDGRPIRKRRYAYSECFAAIAYGELALATGENHYRERAIQAFNGFVNHNLNSEEVTSKFTVTRPTRGMGFPMMTIATAQELRQSIGLPDADRWIDRSVATIREFHLKADIQCVMETVGVDGQILDHFDGRTLNPGHAIEGAWFIMWEGHLRGDTSLIETGCQMLRWMWQRGWDQQHGGILYFVDVYGLPVQEYWHDMKFWWPQNESILATLLAYLLTGEDEYAQWHQQIHDWAYSHFPDREHGEWFGYLHRDGSLSSEIKGNLWKGPFHLPRMQYMAWRWLEKDLV
ncbi:MAG TPA: N-acylglucosamine 2-epimerase [Rhodopirellula baltica]|uniref:N-acylglucosamine 2-epimerase n=1 Tax=Rhodopirellula baltica (strain DSM 10527 / NCIMB 13988 / SH1) TaxID=243090 RepID=Q7UUE2_RHOBA|nr:AGE family epimerase/isomerase [Rhodopirellula baltica]CAD73138.1 N-acylglucosamine 2-epimerase [Rhodopirellula baltica SH 1]HBE61782.1 N-acylglucosamine 2-epimerase [Rhodopirellula baltica]